MSNSPTHIAVLGLGAMGHAFATNLLKQGFEVSGWNRRKAKGEDLVELGLQLTDTPEQAVAEAEVTLLMLSDGEVTQQVISQCLSAFASHSVICQMGTIGLAATRQLTNLLQEARADVQFVDAPVSGTKKPAENAQITVLASGSDSVKSRVLPVFNAISKATHWLGESGQGTAMKLVVNSYLLGLMQSLAESHRLAKQLGFDASQFWDVLDGGPLASPYAKMKLDMIQSQDFTPQMQLIWAHKDAALALDAGSKAQLPALANLVELWQQAIEAGCGEKDLAVIEQYLAQKH